MQYAITWNAELADVRVYRSEDFKDIEAAVTREPCRSVAYATTADDLRLLNSSLMVKLYNELAARSGVSPVKKFEDKATACRRLFSRMEENAESAPEAEPPAAEPEPEENAQMAKAKTKAKTKVERKPREVGKPAKAVSEFHQMRAGTKRAEVLKLMDGSLSLEQVSKRAELEPARVLAHCFCTWRDCGIGYAVEDGKLVAKYPGQRGYADAIQEKAQKK